MSTRNGQTRKYRIPGTSLVTDKASLEQITNLQNKYVGQEHDSALQKSMTQEVRGLLEKLVEEGKVTHKDGYQLSGSSMRKAGG